MMRSRQLNSPRSSNAKQLKNFTLTGLNSYKIDTSSLQEKAKEVQQLKIDLQTQISQYKDSQVAFHEQTQKLIEQNKQLKGKIKKLQSELNQLKKQLSKKQRITYAENINQNNSNNLELKNKIQKLQKKLKEKDELISSVQQYRKMYEIEVENKNNIQNFYETKFQTFKKDKATLISRYEQKISVLGSGLQMNGTIIQSPMPGKTSQKINNDPQLQMNTRFEQKNSQDTKAKVILKQNPSQKALNYISGGSNRNIKFLKTSSRNSQNIFTKQVAEQTPYKLLKTDSRQQLDYQTPKLKVKNSDSTNINIYNSSNYQKSKNDINEISISSTSSIHKQPFLSNRNGLKTKELDKINNNIISTNKTIRHDTNFMNLMKQVSNNLRNQNLKSENIKNFNSIKSFINIQSPTQSQIIKVFQTFPLAPIQMEHYDMELAIDHLKKYLIKKYQTFNGNLIVETIIDKIEDFQIAYEVNSEDDGQIVAGLSSNDEEDE